MKRTSRTGAAARRRITRSRACGEKKQFANEAAAEHAASEMHRIQPWQHERIAYLCPYSGTEPHWHIGRPLNIPKQR
ncbi:hypothetical protein ACQKM2_09190 [Streptomyces sp. NPDC004126]|uniref:hypothetical protein n=1 Tax=Streptomyces TaxID=1883 RepID=UPI000F6E79A0|nr:hypothetical protein [Streptomyces sp. W1SF4]AZM91738.1 hypothetical protein D1J60_27335 [Streptomyces sp. W1SF4]